MKLMLYWQTSVVDINANKKVRCIPTTKVTSTPGGGRVYTSLDTLPPPWLPYPPIPYPWKGHGTRDTLLPGNDLVPGISYSVHCGQNDRHLWKHYLPAISLAVGNEYCLIGTQCVDFLLTARLSQGECTDISLNDQPFVSDYRKNGLFYFYRVVVNVTFSRIDTSGDPSFSIWCVGRPPLNQCFVNAMDFFGNFGQNDGVKLTSQAGSLLGNVIFIKPGFQPL